MMMCYSRYLWTKCCWKRLLDVRWNVEWRNLAERNLQEVELVEDVLLKVLVSVDEVLELVVLDEDASRR